MTDAPPRLVDLFDVLRGYYAAYADGRKLLQEAMTMTWFTNPHQALGGAIPANLWDEGRKDEVMAAARKLGGAK